MFALSHNGPAVFFQAEKWEERHLARKAHGVREQRGVNKGGMLRAMNNAGAWGW